MPTGRNRETTATQRESDYKRSGSTHHDLIDWWVGTVVLAFFPSILSAIFSLSRNATLDLNRIIGDGELILTSFLITAPSLISYYKENLYQKGYKGSFYLLLFSAFLQLVVYTSIKTNNNNIPRIVYVSSTLCVLSAIIFSYAGEKRLNKEENLHD